MADTSLDFRCFVCNIAGVPATNGVPIFEENAVLSSGLKLSEAVSQILGRDIDPLVAHSSIICRKCHKTCEEYDEINKRLSKLKSKMADQFRQTLPKYNLNYDSYNQGLQSIKVQRDSKEEAPETEASSSRPMKTLVIPKSKMTAISPNFVMNKNKVSPVGNANSPVNLKNCIFISPKKGTSLIKPKQMTMSTSKEVGRFDIPPKGNTITLTSPSTSTASTSEQYFETSHTTDFSDIFENSVTQIEKTLVNKVKPKNAATHFPSSALTSNVHLKAVRGALSQNSDTPLQNEDKYLISQVEIMEDDHNDGLEDDEEETILMDQDGSIIQVVRGEDGKLMFPHVEHISLVMPQRRESDSDTNEAFKIECQDSNDDTQIELQMSGDEETANAIIAAAKDQGATYIKVKSGEMYRVDSYKSEARVVRSKPSDSAASVQIVERIGTSYRCLLCKPANEIARSDSGDDVSTEPEVDKPEHNQFGVVYKDHVDIMLHIKSTHHLRIYTCPICGDLFRKRSEINEHMVEHGEKRKHVDYADKVKPHKCVACSKKYGSKTLLEEHMNVHTGQRPHSCSVCGKGFASKYTYNAHLKTHTERARPYVCPQCDKCFFTVQNLSQHQKTHSNIKEFACKICNKEFVTQHNLDVHGIVHSGDKPFVCGVCEKPFARRAEIRDHMRTHTGERPFECEICNAKFSQRSNLLTHRRATHFDDKRHACQHCEKRFKRRRLLDYHIKASHTGERPYKCDECSATFVYPEHYKKHIRIHSGEKPYVCEVCNRTFNSRDNRNAHRFTHSEKKPYECMVCGAGYMRKPLLYAHMNTQGHLTDMIVVNQARLADKPATVAETHKSEETIVPESTKLHTSRTLAETNISEILCEKMLIQKMNHTEMETEDADNANEVKTISLVQTDVGGDHSLLTLTGTITDGTSGDHGLLSSAEVEELLAQGSEVITTDSEGNILRLVEIQLPDGKNGWVALDS